MAAPNMLRLSQNIQNILKIRNTQPLAWQRTYVKASIEEKLGLPEKPKKPSPPFIKFITKMRPQLMKQNPKLRSTEASKLGSEKWHECDASTKKVLEEQYMKEKEAYSIALAKYNACLTEEQKEEIREAKQELKELKHKRQEKRDEARKLVELGKPKKPLTSFLLFAQTQYKYRGDLSVKEYIGEIGKKWAGLSESEKKKFTNEYEKEKMDYEKRIAAWEQKMVKEGHTDVVRSTAVPKVKKVKP